MDKTYLFFDIECANCFGGVGKMCSFGYVLVNQDWTILDEDDVVMNPETEFDWYLFDSKHGCKLAYSKDYFRAQHNFESFHSGIKKLMEASGRKILGFSVKNDMGFLQSACERYNLPSINYAAYDIAKIIDSANNVKNGKGLEEWCKIYKVSCENLVSHKSSDDAKMTMLLFKAFCEQNNETIDSLIEKNKGIKLSLEKFLEQREISRHNKEIAEKISALYGKKAKAFLSQRLSGNFAFGFKIKNDADFSLKIAELIYKHGGILQKILKSNGTVVVEDDCAPEIIENIHSRNLKTMKISEILEITRME